MKVIYQAPVPELRLPCGYQIKRGPFVHGRMRELQDHYRTCSHRFCQWRRRVRNHVFKKVQNGITRKEKRP